MKISIMQPTFMPWLGYFEMINQVDKFIFLDNVQFEKQSWQSRNKIKSQNKELYITLHIQKMPLNSKIQDIKLSTNQHFKIKLLKTLKQNYAKSINFDKYYSSIENILLNATNLCQVNIDFIQFFLKILNINTPLYRSSELGLPLKQKDCLVIDICKYFNAKTYLSASGSKTYMNIDLYEKQNIEVVFFEYKHPTYSQIGEVFISHLSIIDFIFNHPEPQAFFNNHFSKKIK
ncbi:WbqC family protein [Campylobacter lari]|uniref:WbqC family protein n=1 Tax=Campylobacter lari TaxID=201 RepID=UPI00127DDC34|nr:WbqC family protein [Campylobacter lari]ECK1948092.1 WbqC family protein [Campylobacter lari]MBT0819158.1 WbqC family protein [Campylobacter lari]MBT0820928.1 WbqC family protein [Campylobacter lari]MBT0832653.1 WbqC family protein [Campylobacter lari]